MKLRTVWAAVTAVVLAGAASANLLTNPGFETGDFTGWSQNGWYNGGIGDAHSGSYAGNYFISSANVGENFYVAEQYVPVTGGQSYDLAGWMRIAGTVDASESFMELRWLNSSGGWEGQFATDHLTTVGDYAQFSLLQYMAPGAAVTARVAIVVHTTGGTIENNAWHMFDDISFAETIPEPATLGLTGLGIALAVYLKRRVKG